MNVKALKFHGALATKTLLYIQLDILWNYYGTLNSEHLLLSTYHNNDGQT